MVQLLLTRVGQRAIRRTTLAGCAALLMVSPILATKDKKKEAEPIVVPDLLMDGGRKLSFERTFHSEREVKPKRGFWNKVVDVIAGAPEYHNMVRPYSITTD